MMRALIHVISHFFRLAKKKLGVRRTSIQHRGLAAFVPHTIMVSLTFWMTVMKLSHSICERKRKKKKKRIERSERGITVSRGGRRQMSGGTKGREMEEWAEKEKQWEVTSEEVEDR